MVYLAFSNKIGPRFINQNIHSLTQTKIALFIYKAIVTCFTITWYYLFIKFQHGGLNASGT